MLTMTSPIQGVVIDAKDACLLLSGAVVFTHPIDLIPVYFYQRSSHQRDLLLSTISIIALRFASGDSSWK
jgi:hypothetical protein